MSGGNYATPESACPEINFWEFPDDFRFGLTKEARDKYWTRVKDAYREQCGQEPNCKQIGSLLIPRSSNPSAEIGAMMTGFKFTSNGYHEIRTPLSLFKAAKERLEVEYHDLQDSIQSYSSARCSVSIFETRNKTLPIRFTPSLAMILSGAMWIKLKEKCGSESFRFKLDRENGSEQGLCVHQAVEEHYGNHRLNKKGVVYNMGRPFYIVSKSAMDIGLSFLDKQLSAEKPLSEPYYAAIILGSCINGKSEGRNKIRFMLPREDPHPMNRVVRALDALQIEHTPMDHGEIILTNRGVSDLYARALELSNQWGDVSELLEGVMGDLARLVK